jgi:cytochrome c biogenesis protein CcdA
MASFAIGQSIPLFAIGLFSNLLGSASERWSVHVRRIAGIALIGSGLYFLLKG